MIKNYFKIALRGFKRHKLFTFINIIGLSIGISTALVIYLIVHFDLSFDKFHPGSDRMYRVVTDFTFAGEPNFNGGVTGPLAATAKNEVTGLDGGAHIWTSNFNVLINEDGKAPQKFKNEGDIVYADGDYFKMFQYNWLAGSSKTALNAPHQVVLAAKQAKKYFPKLSYGDMIGKQVIYDDTIKMAVTGIVQDFTENTDFMFHDFLSFATAPYIKNMKGQLTSWGGTTSSSIFFVKLSPKATVAGVEKQLNGLLKKYNPQKKEDKGNTQIFKLQPFADFHFDSKYYGFGHSTVNMKVLYGLMTIAGFILLLGCINFINLTTAQSAQRAKEIGIRKTMGSDRKQLIFQFLSETFLITLFAVIISVAITPLILKLFSDFTPEGLKVSLLFQPHMIIFLLLLTLVVSFLSGLYPALVLSSYKPVLVLKNQAQRGSSKTRKAVLRKSLTVTQFIIAQFFIMATVLISKQTYYALHKDLGFRKDAIVYIDLPWRVQNEQLKQVYINKVISSPQVKLSAIGGDVPSSGGWSSSTVSYTDGKREIKTDLQMKSGDENYLKIYNIKLLAGRNIRMSDTATGIMINKTYADILGFKNVNDALGKTISFGEKEKFAVVGVVGDFHQGSLHTAIKPMGIKPEKYNLGTIHLLMKPETPGGDEWKAAFASMEKDWKELFPDADFKVNFFDKTIADFYRNEQRTSTLLTWATSLSILISCLGLLGLAIYTTNQRTKEIGVRKVLGASVASIVRLLSTELIWLILLAFVIVTPLAWWLMNKWMEDYADRTIISWWIFALSGGAMLLAAVVTSSFQTVKAAIANPVKSLRSE